MACIKKKKKKKKKKTGKEFVGFLHSCYLNKQCLSFFVLINNVYILIKCEISDK